MEGEYAAQVKRSDPHAPERQERIRKYRRDVQHKRPIGWIPPQIKLFGRA